MTTKKFTPSMKRGPRLTPGEINVTPPDDLGIEIPASGMQKAMPYVMGGGMLGMIAIMIFTGVRQLSPYMLMMPLMMVMMMVGGIGRWIASMKSDAAMNSGVSFESIQACARRPAMPSFIWQSPPGRHQSIPAVRERSPVRPA